jgi:hypothetical protein
MAFEKKFHGLLRSHHIIINFFSAGLHFRKLSLKTGVLISKCEVNRIITSKEIGKPIHTLSSHIVIHRWRFVIK